MALAVLLLAVAVDDAVADDLVRADEVVMDVRSPDVGMVLVSTDEAAGRAVVRLDDGALRVVEVGDTWRDGRGRVEAVTADKLVARFRFERHSDGHHREGASVPAGAWLRVWIHHTRSGERESRVQVLRQLGPLTIEGQPIAAEGASRRVEKDGEGDGEGEGDSPTSQR